MRAITGIFILSVFAFTPGSTMRTTAAIEEIQLDNDAVSLTLKPTAVEK
jgi:hypothetical protein